MLKILRAETQTDVTDHVSRRIWWESLDFAARRRGPATSSMRGFSAYSEKEVSPVWLCAKLTFGVSSSPPSDPNLMHEKMAELTTATSTTAVIIDLGRGFS